MKKTFIAIVVCALFTTVASAANETGKNMLAESKMAADHKMAAVSKGVRVINVVTELINTKTRYSPAVYIVKSGEKVQFKIFNATEKPHGFSIDAFKIKGNLVPGDNIIEFTPNKVGLYEVYCQYHPAHLTAQLLVVK